MIFKNRGGAGGSSEPPESPLGPPLTISTIVHSIIFAYLDIYTQVARVLYLKYV